MSDDLNPDTDRCDGCGNETPVDDLTTIQAGVWPLHYCAQCLIDAGLA